MCFFFLANRGIMQFVACIAPYPFYRYLWISNFFDIFRCYLNQIEPYYRSLFRILRPIISVFLRVLFIIYFGNFPPYYRVFFRLSTFNNCVFFSWCSHFPVWCYFHCSCNRFLSWFILITPYNIWAYTIQYTLTIFFAIVIFKAKSCGRITLRLQVQNGLPLI